MTCLLLFNAIGLVRAVAEPGLWTVRRAVETLGGLLIVVFFTLVISGFMRRLPAKATHPSRLAAVAALAATWLPFVIALIPHGPASLLQLVVANSLLLLGNSLSVWALARLDRSFSMTAQAREVVRDGPYALVRHPLYTGELTALLGMVLLRPSPYAGLLFLALLGLQIYRARQEESVLALMLPEYVEYKRSTPSLLPRPQRGNDLV